MKILKQAIGVDVAQKELVVTLGRLSIGLATDLYARKTFSNTESGFKTLHKWVKNLTIKELDVYYVMEPTGIYHEKFAHYLDEMHEKVCLVVPNKISSYMRTLDIKTSTDSTCADAIARFGLERNLILWQRPNSTYKKMQQLTRERDQIVEERVRVKNQLHAENSEGSPNANSIKRLKARIKFLNQQEREVKQDLNNCVKQDNTIKQKVDKLTTIPGVGKLTAQIILAETNGFELIKNKKQLTSYTGLDIIEKQSGTSVRGKSRISKKGNRHLRKSLYLPALSAIKYVDQYKDLYARIVAKSGLKMKGLVAVQRKILELTFILFKNDTEFEPEYHKRKGEQLNIATPL